MPSCALGEVDILFVQGWGAAQCVAGPRTFLSHDSQGECRFIRADSGAPRRPSGSAVSLAGARGVFVGPAQRVPLRGQVRRDSACNCTRAFNQNSRLSCHWQLLLVTYCDRRVCWVIYIDGKAFHHKAEQQNLWRQWDGWQLRDGNPPRQPKRDALLIKVYHLV